MHDVDKLCHIWHCLSEILNYVQYLEVRIKQDATPEHKIMSQHKTVNKTKANTLNIVYRGKHKSVRNHARQVLRFEIVEKPSKVKK